MRPSCIVCVKKHLSQAMILLAESQKGYPEHVYLAIGHMAEAEDESIQDYPDLAAQIRADRQVVEKGGMVDLVKYVGGHSHPALADMPSFSDLTKGVVVGIIVTLILKKTKTL